MIIFLENPQMRYYLGYHMCDQTIVLCTGLINATQRLERVFSTSALLTFGADNYWLWEAILCIVGHLAESLIPKR